MRRLQIRAVPVPLRIDDDGVVRVGPTRVTLDTVIHAYRQGSIAEEIVEQYPSLDLAEVHGAIAYYLMHRAEVDEYLRTNDAEAGDLRREIESNFDQRGWRERLLARQAARQQSP